MVASVLICFSDSLAKDSVPNSHKFIMIQAYINKKLYFINTIICITQHSGQLAPSGCNSILFLWNEVTKSATTPASPGWDTSLSQGYPPAFHQASLTLPQYSVTLLGGQMLCKNTVSCPRTEHNDPATE